MNLASIGMGHTEELTLTPGKRLDNDYSGNVVDLCPVGALTDKDFRFKRRVCSCRPSHRSAKVVREAVMSASTTT